MRKPLSDQQTSPAALARKRRDRDAAPGAARADGAGAAQLRALSALMSGSAQVRRLAALRDMADRSVQPRTPDTVIQRVPTKVQTTGVTHLVRLNRAGSLYQEDYTGNEVAETEAGDTITVEPDDVIRSRRGPNQEADPTRDRERPPEHEWTSALEFNKRALPPDTFIRSGTYRAPPAKQKGQAKKKKKTGEKNSLLLSYDIPADGPVYLIDAAHRGDMYQLRAALAVERHPVIIYNFKGENDLSNYLSNAKGVETYKLAYNPALPVEEDFVPGRVFRSVTVYSESDTTRIVVRTGTDAGAIKEGMSTIPAACKLGIDEAVTRVFSGVPANAALLMYRDSGETGLVYPELDSGAALPQLAEMLGKKGMEPVLCGAPKAFGHVKNIGFYWEELVRIPDLAKDEIPEGNPKAFKRDIEANFMRRAFEMKKYSLVIGFRSGALDLFTLLGVPTISISLRDIVGEDRHGKFSHDPRWQRTNIQYDVPRNPEVTRLMPGRGESQLYMSPYWKMRMDSGPLEAPKGGWPKGAPPPGPFHEADLPTVDYGIDVGLARLRGERTTDTGVITRDALHDFLPPELAIAETRQQAKLNRPKLRALLEVRMRRELAATEIRRRNEIGLAPERERAGLLNALKLELRQQEESLQLGIEKFLALRLELAGKREDSASSAKGSDEPQPPVRKPLPEMSPNARQVFDRMAQKHPERIPLPDSRNKEAVQAAFGLEPGVFFPAYMELKTLKLAHHDKGGPYITKTGTEYL